jgi:hypothetical protein
MKDKGLEAIPVVQALGPFISAEVLRVFLQPFRNIYALFWILRKLVLYCDTRTEIKRD